jgi:hypothetical protein
LYEGDVSIESDAAMIYSKQGSNWGFSNTGDFMDDNNDGSGYKFSSQDSYFPTDTVYYTARKAAISLTYYGYCLEDGIYTVKLDFAEIQFTDDELYKSVGNRFFDIYIQVIEIKLSKKMIFFFFQKDPFNLGFVFQGKLEKQDFNIKKAANGSNKAYSIEFKANVTDNTLEIRLYWNGKGTTCIPKRGNYGPLISAITVCSGMFYIYIPSISFESH